MRAIICLLLVAVLFQGTLAVTSRATQKKLMLEKINKQMEKSHLGRAMKNMITLASKLNYSYDDLELAFNTLSASLLSAKESENNLYDDQTLSHNTQVEIISANIATYEGQVADGEVLVDELNQDLEDASNTLVQQQNELSTAQENLSDAEEERDNLVAAHDADVADYQEALEFIQDAVVELSAAQDSYNSAGLDDYSFIQVKNSVASFMKKLSAKTQNMRASHQLFIKPAIQALNQVASNTKDSSIQNAINALNDLAVYFQNGLNAADALFSNDLDNVDNRIAAFESQIDLLSNVLIPQTENDISSLNQQLEVAESDLEVARENLADQQQALVDENDNFDKVTARHEALVARITAEYSLVIQAQNIINDAKDNLE